jgi:hypothetical protein
MGHLSTPTKGFQNEALQRPLIKGNQKAAVITGVIWKLLLI